MSGKLQQESETSMPSQVPHQPAFSVAAAKMTTVVGAVGTHTRCVVVTSIRFVMFRLDVQSGKGHCTETINGNNRSYWREK